MRARDEAGRFTYKGEATTKRGYPMLYIPSHHRAKANGYVFEHIVVAERKIGRELRENEVVHHIDEDKTNNLPENLDVVNNNSIHVKEHWAKRSVRYLCNGQMMTMSEMAMASGAPYQRIYQRIKRLGWDATKAVQR